MENGKTKRPVTSCQECYRRKQKCNRQKPCNHCISRSVQSRCIYNSNPTIKASSPPSSEEAHSTPASASNDRHESPENSTIGLQYRLGYASTPAANAITDLKEVLNGQDGLSNLHLDEFPTDNWTGDRNVSVQLPPRKVLDELLESYFEEGNWYMQILDRYYFDAQLESYYGEKFKTARPETSAQEMRYFSGLLHQLVAMALLYSGSDTPATKSLNMLNNTSMEKLAERFSDKGEQLINSAGRTRPALTAIQHDLMRASFLKNTSRGLEAWYPLGTALRQAQDLGLHLLVRSPQIATENLEEALLRYWYEEHKRRLWIVIFIWDSHMSAALGRPRSINRSDCTTTRPMDCVFPSDPSRTIPMGPPVSGEPSAYSGILFIYDISHKIHESVTLGLNKRNVKIYDQVLRISSEIKTLMSDVPAVVRPTDPDTSWDSRIPAIAKARELIASTGNVYLLWLHRPHSTSHIESREAAIEAAIKTLESQHRWWQLTSPNRWKLFTLSLYTFDAAVFLEAFLLQHRGTVDRELEAQIIVELRKALKRLGAMRDLVPMANGAEQAIRRYLRQILEDTDRSGEPSVITPASSTNGSTSAHSGIAVPENIGMGPTDMTAFVGSGAEMEVNGYNGLDMWDPSIPDFSPEMLDLELPDTSVIFENITQPDYVAATWMQTAMNIDEAVDDPITWIH